MLRQVAKSIIVAPGWNEEPGFPITLVHGKKDRACVAFLGLIFRFQVSLAPVKGW